MKLGERIYTPEEASQALGGMYAASTLKNMATRSEIAHLGGINGKTRLQIGKDPRTGKWINLPTERTK